MKGLKPIALGASAGGRGRGGPAAEAAEVGAVGSAVSGPLRA